MTLRRHAAAVVSIPWNMAFKSMHEIEFLFCSLLNRTLRVHFSQSIVVDGASSFAENRILDDHSDVQMCMMSGNCPWERVGKMGEICSENDGKQNSLPPLQ